MFAVRALPHRQLVCLPAYRPKLRQAQTLIQQESQAQATFVQERQVEPPYADVQWLSPGTPLTSVDGDALRSAPGHRGPRRTGSGPLADRRVQP